jgi:tRNA U34 5-carboxymethylaminomethyl modifying GTPase MnmE/TrmE
MGILHILLRIPKEIDPKKLETYKWINKSDLKNEDFRRFMRKTNDRVQKSNISKNEQVQEFLAFVKKRAEKVNVLDNREDTLKNKESYDLLKTRMQIIVQSLEKLHGAFDTADVQKYLHAERLNDYFIPSNKDFLDVVNFKIL